MSKKRIRPLDFRQLSPHLQYIWKLQLCWGSIVNNFLLNTCPGFPRYFACPKLPSVQKIPSCVGLAHPCPVGWADARPWVDPPQCPRVVALECGSRDLEQGPTSAGRWGTSLRAAGRAHIQGSVTVEGFCWYSHLLRLTTGDSSLMSIYLCFFV